MVEYGPQAPIITAVATAVQRTWACHTRTVLPAGAYARQACNVVLSACYVVYLWYTGTYVWALLWAHDELAKGQKTQNR